MKCVCYHSYSLSVILSVLNDSFCPIQGESGPTGSIGVPGTRGAPVSTIFFYMRTT